MLVTDRINKVISGKKIITREQLLNFWRHRYINLTEDAKMDEYNKLKEIYFVHGETYENMLKVKPSAAEDELLYKKYMIMQRKAGIRMIALASGTDKIDEARTFEAQTAGTPAGDRSVSNIRYMARSKQQQAQGFSYGGAGGGGAGGFGPMKFTDFIKFLMNEPRARRIIIFKILFAFVLELIKFLTSLLTYKIMARKAILNGPLSDLMSRIAGENIIIKTIGGSEYRVFGFGDSVIISKEALRILTQDELVAMVLYCHGARRKDLSRTILLGTIRSIITGSSEIGMIYATAIELQKSGREAAMKKYLTYGLIRELVLIILIGVLDAKIGVHDGIKYVKEKGYIKQLMSAKRKIPSEKSRSIPNVDDDTAERSVKHFKNLLNVVNLKEHVDKDDVSNPISKLSKAASIFRKF